MNNISNKDSHWQFYALILLLLYVLIYLVPLGLRPLMIPDEVRYAEIPREMIQSGNWVVPHLNGLRYFEKPVLGYWLVAGSMQLFGENAFAVRLPGALSAGLSALAIFLLLAGSGRTRKTALSAAMIYLTLFGVFLMGSYNILDNSFSFFLTAAFVAFYYAHNENNPRRRFIELVLLGVFCGAAFLTKGFLAFALLGIVIGPYVIWQGRWRELLTRGWLPTLVALLVILPWAILIQLQQPDYWHYFFWVEHIKRFASDHAQHEQPAWFYLTFLPLLAWPWITQIVAMLKGLSVSWLKAENKNPAERNLIVYCLLWFLLPFVFFSIAHGKLPTYILPCLPPLAILLAIGLQHYLSGQDVRQNKVWFTAGAWLTVVFLLALSGFVVWRQNGELAKRIWYDNESWKWLLLCAAFIFSAAVTIYSTRIVSGSRKILAIYAFSLVPVMLAAQFILPERTAERKMPGKFLLQNAHQVSKNTLLVTNGNLVHAVNWYFKRSDVYQTSTGELSYGMSYADSAQRLLGGKKLQQFLSRNINKKPIVIVTQADAYQKMKALLPARAKVSRWGDFVLWAIPVKAGQS